MPYYLLAMSAAQTPTVQPSPLVIHYYREAIRRNPQYAFYYFYLAEYFARHQNFTLATYYLARARIAYPSNERFENAWRQLQSASSLPNR